MCNYRKRFEMEYSYSQCLYTGKQNTRILEDKFVFLSRKCERSSSYRTGASVLEYGSLVLQNRAARFVTGNYVFETGSGTGKLGQLKRESLRRKRRDSRVTLL